MAARLVEKPRKYVRTELKGNDVGKFREYCRDMHINFETSEVGEYIHFECLMNEDEMDKANDFIDTL